MTPLGRKCLQIKVWRRTLKAEASKTSLRWTQSAHFYQEILQRRCHHWYTSSCKNALVLLRPRAKQHKQPESTSWNSEGFWFLLLPHVALFRRSWLETGEKNPQDSLWATRHWFPAPDWMAASGSGADLQAENDTGRKKKAKSSQTPKIHFSRLNGGVGGWMKARKKMRG